MEELLSIYKEEYKKILDLYNEKITLYNHQTCSEQENQLFENLDDKKRIQMELRLIKRSMDTDIKRFMLYNDYYNEIISKLEILNLTREIIPEIKSMILLLDLSLDLPIHLYSAIPILLEYIKENYNARKKHN